MKKQTKVLLAAAMMTLGASFSALAAETKGSWILNEEGWQYADKDGEYVEEKWCVSNGIEFWINDDEVLGGSEWVKDGSYTYYAQSDGSKTKNAWKYLYDISDEDEEEDQYWYYFDAKGRMLKDTKKEINGYTYYFNEKGQMLTGWVDAENFEKAAIDEPIANVVFTNKDGQLAKSTWLEEFPWTKKADDCYEGEDEIVAYAGSNGKLYNTKKDVDGHTYFFNSVTGEMFTGWVIKGLDDVYTAATTKFNKDFSSNTVKEAYWTDEAGYAKKNGWREAECPADEETYWYHFDKLGRAFLATTSNTVAKKAQAIDFDNGEVLADQFDETAAKVIVNAKKIDGKEYFFKQNGAMIDGLQKIGGKLFFLKDGVKVTGKVDITDNNENEYEFLFAEKTEDGQKKYEAVHGYFDKYMYVNGQLIKSEDSDTYRWVSIGEGEDEKWYVVDYKGKVQHKDGENYGLAAEGKKLYFNADDSWKETK